jgi:hypothetical protein
MDSAIRMMCHRTSGGRRPIGIGSQRQLIFIIRMHIYRLLLRPSPFMQCLPPCHKPCHTIKTPTRTYQCHLMSLCKVPGQPVQPAQQVPTHPPKASSPIQTRRLHREKRKLVKTKRCQSLSPGWQRHVNIVVNVKRSVRERLLVFVVSDWVLIVTSFFEQPDLVPKVLGSTLAPFNRMSLRIWKSIWKYSWLSKYIFSRVNAQSKVSLGPIFGST